MKRMRIATTLLLLTLLAPAAALTAQGGPARPELPAASPGGLIFIENAGQWPDATRFQVWGGGQTLWLAEDAIWLTIVERSNVGTLRQAQGRPLARFDPERVNVERENMQRENVQRVNVKLSFPGADPQPVLEPFDRLETHVSYFIGADPEKWRADVPVWGGVRYVDLYPGVDLIVGAGLAPALDAPALDDGRPQGSPLQWRLEARAGADLAAVRLRVEGADAVAVDDAGLRLSTAAGDLTLPLLTAERQNVERANVEHANGQAFDVTAPFALARANPAMPATAGHAVASPQSSGLPYATYLGGGAVDTGDGIAVDGAGQAYVTGSTGSADFPASPGYDAGFNGGYDDAFVVKFNAAGTGLLYATFLGGSNDDSGSGIAVDGAGQAYVTGRTSSADFPAGLGPGYDTSYNGPYEDAFVVKLNAAGTGLRYATFLGGSYGEGGDGIAVDSAGQAYVTGTTGSADFPASRGPGYDTSHNGRADAFVVKFNAAGTSLRYATFLGGSRRDTGDGIAVDGAGQAYVTGWTESADGPASLGPGYDTSFNGDWDTYVVKLDAAGTGLRYATFLGGSGYDVYGGIAVDGAGQAYVTGETDSADFPASLGPGYDTSYNGYGDAFVVKLDAAGAGLVYATFLGGSYWDRGWGIAVDGAGQAYVTGGTGSADFPASLGPGYDTSCNSGGDVFVIKLDAAGAALRYATFLGGSKEDWGLGIATDGVGQAYVTGDTYSTDFPATLGAFDTSYGGGSCDGEPCPDAFVAKLDTAALPTATPTATATLTPTPTSTPTPTATPTGPWATWAGGSRPLLVPPAGAAAVVDYGNQAPPVPFAAHVTGAALFDTGAISGTTSISTTLPAANGSYMMTLIPAVGATAGQTLTVRVEIGPVMLTKDGWIVRPTWLPLIMRR